MGSRIIPSPLGGALGTSRDRIFCLAVAACPTPPTSPSYPPSPPTGFPWGKHPSRTFRLPLPTSPPACIGRLSQTEEEAWLPGRVGLPGMAQPQCDPTSPGNSPNLGP